MSSKNLLASPETSKYPSLAGYLFRKGFFNDWAQRHVKLENNVITVKNGMTSVTFKLSADTKCDDSTLRAHCFTLSNPSSSDKLVLAAENSTLKVSWTTAISDCISKLIQEDSPVTNAVKIIPSTSDSSKKSSVGGKEGQLISPSVSDSATGSKTNSKSTPSKAVVEVKHTVSIRVKHTRKLTVGANHEVFVRLSLNTTVLETKRVKGSESREFDELFTIPWSDSLRYAKAEVFSLPSPHASPELLGTVLLPVYGVKSNSRSSRWYALSKTSDELDATGEVELEVIRQGALTAENKLSLELFEAARQVDFKVADSDTGELSALHFTNTAHENLEDASLQAVMVSIVSDNKISTPGLVFLTNHRLLFASITNIISGHNSSSSSSNKQLMELSTYLLIKDIASITMYQGENDEDTYYIESEAGDSTVFVFTAASAIDSNKPLDEKNMSVGEVCLLKILKEHGGLRAKEGAESPAQRIFDRLNLLTLNKAHLPSLTNCACEDFIAPVETATEEAEVHEHRLSMIAEEQSVASEDDSSAASGSGTDDAEREDDSTASAAISDPVNSSSNLDVGKAVSAEPSVVAASEKLHIEVEDSAEDVQEEAKGDEHKEHKPHHSHHHTAEDESSSGGSDSGEGSDSGSGDDASDSGSDSHNHHKNNAETTTSAAANKVVPSTVVIPVRSTPAAPSNLTVTAPTTPPSTTPTTTPVRKSLLSSFFGGGGSNKEKSSSATGTPPLTPKVVTPTTPSASSVAAPTTPLTPKAVQLQSFLEKKASRSSLSAASAADLLKATNSSASFNVELSSSEDSASGSEEESETDSVKGVANENDLFVSAPNTPSSTTIAESFSDTNVNSSTGSGKKVQLQVDTHHDSSSGGSDSGSEASESDSERESSKPTLKTPVKASPNANIGGSTMLSPQPTTPITPKEAQLRAFLERKSSKKNMVDSDDEGSRDEDKNANKNIAADLSSSDSEASSGESSVASSVHSSPAPAPQALPVSTSVTSSSPQQTAHSTNQQLSSDLDTSSGGESSGGDSSADESGFESEAATPFTTPSKTPDKSVVEISANDTTSPGIALPPPVSTPGTPLTPKQAQLQSFLERKSSKHNFTTATVATLGDLSPEESSGSGSGSSEESEGSGGEDEETSEGLEVEAATSSSVDVALLPPPVPPVPAPALSNVATDTEQFVPPEQLHETLDSASDGSVAAGDKVSTGVDDDDEIAQDAHSADPASAEFHSSVGADDAVDAVQLKDELTIAVEEVASSTDLEVTAAADTAIGSLSEEKVVVPVVETPAPVKAAPLPPRQLPPPLPKSLPPVPPMDPSLFSQDASIVDDASQHSINSNSSVAESLAAQVRSPPPSYTKLFAEIPALETTLEINEKIVEQAIESENDDGSHTLSPLSPLSPLSSAESAESLFTTSSENAVDFVDGPELLDSTAELLSPPVPTQQVPPLPSNLPPPVPVEVNSSTSSTELLELRGEIEQLRREQSEYLETISVLQANILESNAKHAAELERLSLTLQETENSHKELLINLSIVTAEKEVEALKLAQEATQRENKLVEIVTDLESEISLLSSKVLTLTTENNQLQHTINTTAVSNETDGERSGAISDQLLEEKDTLIALHEYSLSQKQETIDIYTQQLIELSTQYQQLETNYNELLENNENNVNNDNDTPPDILSLKMENNRKISELKQAHKIEFAEQNESFSAQLATAKDRESELVGIIYVLEGKEAALKEREESLLQQVAQLEETQSESTERENELASFVRSMKESQKNMLARESELLLTVNRLQTINNATEERESTFQSTINTLESEVTRLKATEKELETFVRDLKESQATAQEKESVAQERENKLVSIVQNLEEAQNLAKERENELVTIILQLETTIEQKDAQIAAAAVSTQQEDVTAALIAEHQKQLESLQTELDSHILLLKERDQAMTDKNNEILSLQSAVTSLTEQITQLNETHDTELTLQQTTAQAALQESLQSSRDEVTRIEQAHVGKVAVLTELNQTLSLELEHLRDTAAAQSAAINATVSDVTAATVDTRSSAAVDAIAEQLAAQTATQQQLQSQYDALLATHNALIVANATAAANTAAPSSPDAVSSPPAGANRRRSVSVTGVDSSTSDIKKYLTIIAQKDSEIASLNSKVTTLDSTVNDLVSSKDSLQLQLDSTHSENMELQTAVRDIKRKSKSKEQVESALATMLIRKSIRKSLHIPIGTDLSAVPQTYHDNENSADNSYELQYYANSENKEQFAHSSPLLKQALTTNTMTGTSSSNNLYTSGNDSTTSSVTGGGHHSSSNRESKGKQKRAAVLDYTQIAPQVSPTVPVARNSMCYSPLSVSSSRCSSPESDGDVSCATYDSKHDNINNFTPLSLNNPKLHRNTIAGSTLHNNTNSNAGDKNTRAHSVMTTGNRNIRNSPSLLTSSNYDLHNLIGSSGASGAGGTGSVCVSDNNSVNGSTTPSPLTHTSSFIMGGGRRRLSVETRKKNNSMLNLNQAYDRSNPNTPLSNSVSAAFGRNSTDSPEYMTQQQQLQQYQAYIQNEVSLEDKISQLVSSLKSTLVAPTEEDTANDEKKEEETKEAQKEEAAPAVKTPDTTPSKRRKSLKLPELVDLDDLFAEPVAAAINADLTVGDVVDDAALESAGKGDCADQSAANDDVNTPNTPVRPRSRSRTSVVVNTDQNTVFQMTRNDSGDYSSGLSITTDSSPMALQQVTSGLSPIPIKSALKSSSSNSNVNNNNITGGDIQQQVAVTTKQSNNNVTTNSTISNSNAVVISAVPDKFLQADKFLLELTFKDYITRVYSILYKNIRDRVISIFLTIRETTLLSLGSNNSSSVSLINSGNSNNNLSSGNMRRNSTMFQSIDISDTNSINSYNTASGVTPKNRRSPSVQNMSPLASQQDRKDTFAESYSVSDLWRKLHSYSVLEQNTTSPSNNTHNNSISNSGDSKKHLCSMEQLFQLLLLAGINNNKQSNNGANSPTNSNNNSNNSESKLFSAIQIQLSSILFPYSNSTPGITNSSSNSNDGAPQTPLTKLLNTIKSLQYYHTIMIGSGNVSVQDTSKLKLGAIDALCNDVGYVMNIFTNATIRSGDSSSKLRNKPVTAKIYELKEQYEVHCHYKAQRAAAARSSHYEHKTVFEYHNNIATMQQNLIHGTHNINISGNSSATGGNSNESSGDVVSINNNSNNSNINNNHNNNTQSSYTNRIYNVSDNSNNVNNSSYISSTGHSEEMKNNSNSPFHNHPHHHNPYTIDTTFTYNNYNNSHDDNHYNMSAENKTPTLSELVISSEALYAHLLVAVSVPENVALIEFVVRINSLTEYLNYYYQFYLHYNNNNNNNNSNNNMNMNSSNNIVTTGREEECHYLRIFLDALNKMMDAELHPHHSTSPAKTTTNSTNHNNAHTTPVKGNTNTHSNTPHKSTTAAICELDAIFEELDNSVDHEYDLQPAVSGGSDSSSNQTAQNTSANKYNNNNTTNNNNNNGGNRDRTPSDISSHESNHQLNSKLTRKTMNNKKNGANLYLTMIQLMKQCEDAIAKIQYYQQNISQNALYNAKNAAKKNLDSLIYTGAKNNADNTPAKPPQNSDLTPEQEEKLAFETQLSNNLKEITALHHTLCNKMVNYNYFQFEELNAMLTSGINNSGGNSSFSSNNNSMFNFFANKIYNFTANSSSNVASGQPKLTTEFVSSRDLFGTPAMSGGGSGGGSGRDTPTRQATAVLISQQSIATVLVRTKNIVLLTAIYETWPNLTVKIPMSSNGLSGSSGNNEMNTANIDHNNSSVLHSPNKSKLHHGSSTPGGVNSLLQSNTFTSPVANRRQNALLQQQQTPTNNSTAGFKTPNRKLYTSGVFTGNQAPYVYAGSLHNLNNNSSSINNNSNSISKTGTSVVGNKINPVEKISRQLSHTASFSFTNTNTLLNTALGGGMHINTTHSDSSGHLYNNPTTPRNNHAPGTPHTPHTPHNSSAHHVFAHGNHHSNSNTPNASPTKHNNVVTTTVTYTVDVDLSAVDFQDCKTLRDIGFTLVQLRESKGYELNTLLMAGFALQEFKHLKGMSITAKDLRLAGYSVSQCVQVGFDAASLRAGGYNDYELVNSHIFHPLALKAIGCDIQRYALMSLFEELDGKHWKNKTNWGSVHPLGEWYGVTVDEGTQSVVRIDLRSNYLKGKLPEALSLLTTLQYLDLYNNQLEGPIPDEYAKLVSLKDLWLTNNKDLIVNRAHLTTQLLPWCKIRLTQL